MTNPTQNPAIRLPLINKLLFASDHIGLQAISYFRQTWALFFLVPPATADITARVPDISLLGFAIDARVFAGFLIFAGRFIDAFTDPIIGWWSDRTRSRWGRRIPFILFSTPFYALFAALIWILPSENPSLWNAIYFVIILELFFTAATMSSGPLEALVPEVTRGASDRMNLVGLIFLFAILGALIGLGGGGILIDTFDFRVTGIILAIIGVTFRYLSLAAIWRHAPRQTPPAQVNFPRALRDTLRNPQFVYYLPTFVMFTTGVGIMMAWVPFFTSELLQADDEATLSSLIFITVITAAVISGLTAWILMNWRGAIKYPRPDRQSRYLISWTSTHWSGAIKYPRPNRQSPYLLSWASAGLLGASKRRIYGLCLIASGAAFPLLSLVGLFSDTNLIMQGIILAFIAGLPMAAVFMLPKGLTADIADYDALLTGERREAMFYATQNFFEKITFALPPALLSLILLLGDTAENPLGIRLAPLAAGALALLGITLWHRYRLPDTITPQTTANANLLPPTPRPN